MCLELPPIIQATSIGTELEIWMHGFVTLKAHLITVHLQKWNCQLLPYAFDSLHDTFPELGRCGNDGIPVLVTHLLAIGSEALRARESPFDITVRIEVTNQRVAALCGARVRVRVVIPGPTPSFSHINTTKLGSAVCDKSCVHSTQQKL